MNSWPNWVVHAQEDVVTIDRPDLLRLDRRHNQAEFDQQVICVYHKSGACVWCQNSRLTNEREHQFYFLLYISIAITNSNSLTSNVGGCFLSCLIELALLMRLIYSSILHHIFCHKLMVARATSFLVELISSLVVMLTRWASAYTFLLNFLLSLSTHTFNSHFQLTLST
jgi:hypothetical protein